MCAGKGDNIQAAAYSGREARPAGILAGSPTSDAVDYSLEGVSESEPETQSPIMTWEPGPPLIVDPPDGKIPYQPWAAAIGRKS